MSKKLRVMLTIFIVGLVVATGLASTFVGPTAEASHIKIFDMNDRNASKEFAGSGTGVSVVTGTSIDFKIMAEGLKPVELWEVIVTIRDPDTTPAESFAQITFEAISDEKGELVFEKNDFDLKLLPPGEYRVDWILAHADFTEPGRTDTGKGISLQTGRDPLLSCQPATFVTVPE